MKVIQVNQTSKRRASKDERFLQSACDQIFHYFLKKKIRNKKFLMQKSELTVVFLTKAQIKKINFQFRKKDKVTDILSFASDDPNSLGELLVCHDVIAKQAGEHGHSVDAELLYMLIHGILHLLDYDHERSKEENHLMMRIQDLCFEKLSSSPA
ncbi:MAG: rRNA maturation RNase YbeY [Pseudobdellovibrio sp.]